MENIEKVCADWFPGIWEIQRFTKKQKPSCLGASRGKLLLASWPLYGGKELWRELFGHQGADGVLVAYDETQDPVLVMQSWLEKGCL